MRVWNSRRVSGFVAIAAAFAFAACDPSDEISADGGVIELSIETLAPNAAVGIGGSAHGVLLDAQGKPMTLSAQGALAKQEQMIGEMLRLPKGPELAHKRSLIVGNRNLTLVERVVVNDGLIEWMIDADPQAARYAVAHGALSTTALSLIKLTPTFWTQRPWLLSLVRSAVIERWMAILRADREAQQYIDECRANRVPIPPDWGSPGWDFRDDLTPDFLGGSPTKVYTATEPGVPGICYALPRMTTIEGASVIGVMGVICQSATTGKACFWDNVDNVTETRVQRPLTTPIAIRSMQNGNTLRENCTQCHRGDNAFNIHPGSALDVGGASAAAVRYAPISRQPAWSNPPPFRPAGSTCTGCHTLPEPSWGLCAFVFPNAANLTMPPAGPIGWSSSDPHVVALRRACGAP